MNKNLSPTSHQFRLLLLSLFLSVFTVTYGQEYPHVTNNMSQTDGQQLENLIEGLNPMVYLTQSEIQTVGNGTPIVARCEIDALNKLYEINPLFDDVQLLRIDIREASDLSNILKPSLLQSFSSLDYILIFFQYDACGNQTADCLQSLTAQFLDNEVTPGIQAIYRFGIIQ